MGRESHQGTDFGRVQKQLQGLPGCAHGALRHVGTRKRLQDHAVNVAQALTNVLHFVRLQNANRLLARARASTARLAISPSYPIACDELQRAFEGKPAARRAHLATGTLVAMQGQGNP